MTRNFLNFLLLTISLGVSIAGYSQSIDTTKFYTITNMVAGEKLAMTGVANTTLGNSVRLRTASDHPMQHWMIEPAPYGGYILYCREYGRNYALEVVNEGSNSKKVSLGATLKNASNQVWKVNINRDGSYRLVSLWQDKAIDYVKSGEKVNQLTLTEIESSILSQTWRLVGMPKPKPAQPAVVYAAPVDTGIPLMDTSAVYKLTCQFRGNGFAMEAVNDENGNIKPMLREAKSDPAQQWKFKFYNTEGGIYRLVNSASTDRSLDIVNDGKQSANLTLAASGNYSGQYWRVIKNVDGSHWFISYWQRGKAIDVVNAGNRDELIMNKSDRFSGQLWNFTKQTPAAVVTEAERVIEQPVVVNDRLKPGDQLKENQKITSANGEYYLIQQSDGNLVIYNSEEKAIWASGMNGKNVKRSVMQKNGSLAQHPGGYDLLLWSTQTDGNNGAYAILQNDGVLAIVNQDNQIIWQSVTPTKKEGAMPVEPTPTNVTVVNNRLVADQELLPTNFITSVNGKYKLIQQEDGNLVIYQGNRPTWSTGTNGRKTQRCVMQKDGNLVLYDIFKDAVWASNTNGNEYAYLILQDDGELVIFNRDNQVIWSSRN